jgi:cysteine synthase A
MGTQREDPVDQGDRAGWTPLVQADGVWAKLECANPGGSVKDRIARFMLVEARERGELRPGDTVVETTSGNTGIALALAGRELGHPIVIFMPEHMSVERRRMMERLGATVMLTPKDEGFEGAVRRRDEYRGRAGHWIPDQFGNPDNTRCHFTVTGPELIAQLGERGVPRVDWLVAGIGTGGTFMGVGRALRAWCPSVKLAAVEPTEAAVLTGGANGPHGIFGIGDGFVPDLVHRSWIDDVAVISTAEATAEATRIRVEHGCCVGVSAGANHLAARRLAAAGAVVATVWPDSSDRYASVGLEPPSSRDVRCPLRSSCVERTARMLGTPESTPA